MSDLKPEALRDRLAIVVDAFCSMNVATRNACVDEILRVLAAEPVSRETLTAFHSFPWLQTVEGATYLDDTLTAAIRRSWRAMLGVK